MERITGDGEPIDQLRGRPGQVVELEAAFDLPEEMRVSWFVTAGTIELYRHNPAEWQAPDEAASGWLFAVGRDDAGSVTWVTMPVSVE
jgi:hypothetical protein